MNGLLKTVLSLSLSGSLVILVLLAGRPWAGRGLGRRWQYYIWLAAVARLLLPFAPEANLMGALFQQAEAETAVSLQEARVPQSAPVEDGPFQAEAAPVRDGTAGDSLWLVWLGGALVLLIRKVTVYQGFVRYVRAGRAEVSDVERLDRLAQIGEQMGVRRPVELWTNPLIFSPMLLGFFRPCIVLPDAGLSDGDFAYTVRHELTHYLRRDMFYKWLVQLTVCLHWFNPLVWLMAREIGRDCELACDEAVISALGAEERRAYGDTLLRAAGAGAYHDGLASISLREGAELLKERLEAIMRFKKTSRWTAALSFVLAGALTVGAAAAGAYTGTPAAAAVKSGARVVKNGAGAAEAERFYQAGNLPLFETAFSRMGESEQKAWLERIYADGEIAFFSVGPRWLRPGSPLIGDFAERFYKDGSISFFSVLADCMSGEQLEMWLDRALDDQNLPFSSMLYGKLDWDGEWEKELDSLEKKSYEKQLEEYRAAGIAVDGKNYYYQGQLVDIFLDVRANQSFYALEMNPAGTVNVKVIRNEKDEVTGAAYMTEAEVAELLGDMDDADDDDSEVSIPVGLKTVAAGKTVLLGAFDLSGGEEIWYDISAETGSRMRVFFTKEGQKSPALWSVDSRCQPGEPLECAGDFTAVPGTYQLFLQAPDGALTNVKGRAAAVKTGPEAAG